MIVVLFRSRLRPEAGADYEQTAEHMDRIARTMPGFVDARSYTSADGERLTLVWWQDEDTLKAWREHPEHLIAQRTGRGNWYSYYRSEVAQVLRSSAFDHPIV